MTKTTSNVATATTSPDFHTDAEHTCIPCLKYKAVDQMLSARHGKNKKKLKAAIAYFAEAFNYCDCHSLERFDEAVSKVKSPTDDVPNVNAFIKARIEAIVAVLNEMQVRDDASAAFTQFLAECYQFDKEQGEDNGGGAGAIEYSREAEPRLAKHFHLTVERVREIIAAADVSQDKHGHDYERLLDDIAQRLQDNDADNCDPEMKADTLAQLAYSEVIYLDSAFANFQATAHSLSNAQRLKARFTLNALLMEQRDAYYERLTKPYAERLAEAEEYIAEYGASGDFKTAEDLVEWRKRHAESNPSAWHDQQREQLDTLLNGGSLSVEDRAKLGFTVYQAIIDTLRAQAN